MRPSRAHPRPASHRRRFQPAKLPPPSPPDETPVACSCCCARLLRLDLLPAPEAAWHRPGRPGPVPPCAGCWRPCPRANGRWPKSGSARCSPCLRPNATGASASPDPVRNPATADALLDALVAAIPADIAAAPGALRQVFGPLQPASFATRCGHPPGPSAAAPRRAPRHPLGRRADLAPRRHRPGPAPRRLGPGPGLATLARPDSPLPLRRPVMTGPRGSALLDLWLALAAGRLLLRRPDDPGLLRLAAPTWPPTRPSTSPKPSPAAPTPCSPPSKPGPTPSPWPASPAAAGCPASTWTCSPSPRCPASTRTPPAPSPPSPAGRGASPSVWPSNCCSAIWPSHRQCAAPCAPRPCGTPG
jgi:hypothetical protein